MGALILAGACSKGPLPFNFAGLLRILPAPTDAPAGTTFVADHSGGVPLEKIGRDEVERAKMRAAGIQAARIATFTTPGLLSKTGSTPAAARYFETNAMLFPDEARARKGLEILRKRSEQNTLTTTLDIRLGERSYGFSFLGLGFPELEYPGFVIGWQRLNAVFLVVVAGTLGTFDQEDAFGLARMIDVRARRELAHRPG